MKKILIVFTFLLLSWSSLFAVYELENYECQGYFGLDNIFVEFYWKQGTAWYKIDNDDFFAMKAHSTDESCFFFGKEEDKHSVSSSSVPCSSEVNSCWVFRDPSLYNYNMYRAYIPSPSTSYIDMGLNENWGAITATSLQNSIEQTLYGPPPFFIATYRVTSMWDFYVNSGYNWNPSASDWYLATELEDIDIKIRLWLYPYGYIYVWDDAEKFDAYNYFFIGVSKSSSKSSSTEIPYIEKSFDVKKLDAYEDINLKYAVVIKNVDVKDFMKDVIMSAFVKEDKEPETVIKVNSAENVSVASIVFEEIDSSLENDIKRLILAKKIVAVNGILFDEFKDAEDAFSYIISNEIYSFSTLDDKMNLFTYEAE